MKLCDRCKHNKRVPSYRFCSPCISQTQREMQDSGYFGYVPLESQYRSKEMREAPKELDNSPLYENAIRILEELR
jgi:hypothetical protein